jgi:hypothetical protein
MDPGKPLIQSPGAGPKALEPKAQFYSIGR